MHTKMPNDVKSKLASVSSEAILQRRPESRREALLGKALHSSSQAMDAGTRTAMEARFKHDFSQVRVHTDTQAAESAQAFNALAYTVGRDIVFGADQYHPRTSPGQRLLAHELTHTLQQGMAAPNLQALAVSQRGDRQETEAAQVSQAGFNPVQNISSGKVQVARQESSVSTANAEEKSKDADQAPAGSAGSGVNSSYTLPSCQSKAVKQWIKGPRGNDDFGRTTLTGTGGSAPEFKVEPAPGGKGVKVKPTHASLAPIQSEFLDVGQYPDSNLTFTQACQPGGDPSCVSGKFPVVWDVTQNGSARLAEGENEHCVDFQLAFYLSLGLAAEHVNQLANGGMVFPDEAAAKQELKKSVKLDPQDWVGYFQCLAQKATSIRDNNAWHTPPLKRVNVSSDASGTMVAKVPIVLTEVKQGATWVHSSWDVVFGSAMPQCNQQFPWKP